MLVEIRTDYDFKDEKVLDFMLKGIMIMHKKRLNRIWVRRSSGNHFHVRFELWLPDEFQRLNTFDFLIGLRLGFADDMGRCIHDIMRKEKNLSTDKLFYFKGNDKKGSNFCGEWKVVYESSKEDRQKAKKNKV